MDFLTASSKIVNTILWLTGFWSRRHGNTARRLMSCFGKEDKKILDFGCGGGEMIRRLEKSDSDRRHYFGVDIAPRIFSNSNRYSFVLFDGKRLPFGDQSFDAAYIIDVLHHLPDRPSTGECLDEIARVTRNRIIIHDYVYETSRQLNALKFTDELINREFGVECPMNFLKRKEWDRLFSKLPFQGVFDNFAGDIGGECGFWWVGARRP